MLKSKFRGLQLYRCCCFPNLRNLAKFSENSNLQQFKVIQGHRSWCQSKAHNFYATSYLLLIASNLGRISYRFRDIK